MKLYTKYFIILIFSLIAKTALSGWVISEVSSDKFGNKQYQTTFIQDKLIRYETESSVAIIDLETENIILLFGASKLYWEGSIEDFKKETFDVFEQKLQNIIQTADPVQKEMARELIAEIKKETNPSNADSVSTIKLTIKNTDIIEQIAGFKATKYEIFVGDSLSQTVWVTDSISPYSNINIKSMISFTRQLSPHESINSIEGSVDYLNLVNKGLAVKSQEKNPLGGFFTTEVSGVIKTNINHELFLAPPTYRKAKLAEIMLIRDENSEYNKLRQEFQNARENPIYD